METQLRHVILLFQGRCLRMHLETLTKKRPGFSALYKQDNNKLSNEDMLKLLADFRKWVSRPCLFLLKQKLLYEGWGLAALCQKSLPWLVNPDPVPHPKWPRLGVVSAHSLASWVVLGGGVCRAINESVEWAESWGQAAKITGLHWLWALGLFSPCAAEASCRKGFLGECGLEGQRETQKPGNRDPVLSSAEDAVPRGASVLFH